MFKALIDLGKSRKEPGVDDRSGLIKDIQERYGAAGDEAPRTLGNVVGESATLLYAVFGEKAPRGSGNSFSGRRSWSYVMSLLIVRSLTRRARSLPRKSTDIGRPWQKRTRMPRGRRLAPHSPEHSATTYNGESLP